jgi:hypothetical protein
MPHLSEGATGRGRCGCTGQVNGDYVLGPLYDGVPTYTRGQAVSEAGRKIACCLPPVAPIPARASVGTHGPVEAQRKFPMDVSEMRWGTAGSPCTERRTATRLDEAVMQRRMRRCGCFGS